MSKKMQIRVALALVFVSVLAFAGYQLLGQQPQLQTQAVTKFWAMIIDNNKDQVALTVQGYSTQTSSLIVAENSAGTDVLTVSNAGAVVASSSMTADSAVIGGGYGSTGCTISTAGVLQCDGASTVGGLVITAGGATISDGDVVIADDVRVTAQTAITVTNAGAFAPTGTYQPIQAAGEVTPTITVGTAGDLLVLINTSAQTINIADTGIQMLSAAWAGGQYDTLTLWCDGTNWIELSRSNN